LNAPTPNTYPIIKLENKVFQHKETKEIFGYGICVAEGDSIDNYMEFDNPDPNNPEYTPHENDNITKGKHR